MSVLSVSRIAKGVAIKKLIAVKQRCGIVTATYVKSTVCFWTLATDGALNVKHANGD